MQKPIFASIVSVLLGLSFVLAETVSAQADRQTFGKGSPFTLNELPAGNLKTQLQGLDPKARGKAMKWLHTIQFEAFDAAEHLRADKDGGIFIVCPDRHQNCKGHKHNHSPAGEIQETTTAEVESAEEPVDSTPPPTTEGAAVSVSSPPAYNSKPGAPYHIYLDFNGAYVTGKAWSETDGTTTWSTWDCKAWSSDADLTTFSDAEQTSIRHMWERVAEDYSSFNVNVTTDATYDPDTYTGDKNKVGWLLITPTTDKAGARCPHYGSGGVAYVGVYGQSNFFSTYQPAWVKPMGDSSTAEAASHEMGHNMGLSHDGTSTLTYYGGHVSTSSAPSWGPIMGTGYNRNVSQWSKATEYYDGNQTQDDFSVITGKIPFRTDEHGDNPAGATVLSDSSVNVSSVIERNTDVDYFTFTTGTGTVSFNANAYKCAAQTWGSNLDIVLELYDSSQTLVASANPLADVDASLSYDVTSSGEYYLAIKPTGCGNPLNTTRTGYTVYGSVGQYTLTGNFVPTDSITLTSPNGGETMYQGATHEITWNSGMPGDVKIELVKGGVPSTLAETTPNDGSFLWTILGTQATGADYRIRVTSKEPSAETDISFADFLISAPPAAVGLPYSESFESSLGAWVQETDDNFDWTRDSGGTPSTDTGPTTGQDGSWYLFTEASGQTSSVFDLSSSWFDLTTAGNVGMTFYYHMYGTSLGSLELLATSDGQQWDSLFIMSGDQGNAWNLATIDLGAYAGSYVKFKFRGTTGTSFSSDVAIDMISITESGYGVVYNGNGGDGGTVPVDSSAYPEGSTVTVLGNTNNLSRTGYQFNGWNTAANGSGTAYVESNTFTMGTSSVTLYAQWTAVPTYTVSYNANGATGSVPSDQTKTQGMNLILATNSGGLQKSGYALAGWNTASDGTGTDYAEGATYTTDADLVLYANWEQYTITYNANGADTGTVPSSQTKGSADVTLATNSGNLAKVGYGFLGWNTAANGSGTSYAEGATYSANADLILYAHWNALPDVNAGADQTVYMTGSDQAWTPADATTVAWYDADDAASITQSGGAVSQWDDKSGNAYHMKQTQATMQPVYTNSDTLFGGRPSISTGPDYKFLTMDQSVAVSRIYVVTYHGDGTQTVFANHNALIGSADGSVRLTGRSNESRVFDGGRDAKNFDNGGTTHRNGSTTNTNYQANGLPINGEIFKVATASAKTAQWRLLGNNASYTLWDGGVGEVIFTDGTESLEVQQKIEGYLAWKWGMKDKLPAAHPYSTANSATGPMKSVASATATLDGSVTDLDGSPTSSWSDTGTGTGTGAVDFVDPNALNTNVTFYESGTYVLRLTGDDGVNAAQIDDMVITVEAAASIQVGAISGDTAETGTTASFDVALGTQPTADVTIGLSSSDTTEGTVSPSSLTFTTENWNTPQTVTVTGVDDAIDDDDITYTIVTAAATSSDTDYNGLNPEDVTVVNIDDDVTLYTVSYNANGADSGTPPAEQSKESTVGLTLATNSGNLAKTGYTFVGWNTASNGSGTDYAEGATYSNDADLTLHAKWIASYTLTFQTDGTSGSSLTGEVNQTVLTGEDSTAVTANPPANHYFVNWTLDGSEYSTANPLTVANVTSNMLLLANFAKTPSISLADDGTIREGAEDGEVIAVILVDGVFANPINASNWTLAGQPVGVTKGSVTRISDTSVSIALSGNRTQDYDTDITAMSVTCATDQVIGAINPTSANSGVTFTATDDAEFIEITDDGWIEEGSEDGELITVVLHGGTYAASLNGGNWTVSNLPSGVSQGAVTRVNAHVATIALVGNSSAPYNGSDITNVSVNCATAEYSDSTGGSALGASTGVTLRAQNSGTLVLQNGLNGYTGNVDTHIYKASPGTNYDASSTLDMNIHGNQTRYGLLRFDLTQIPAGTTITGVDLNFAAGGGQTSNVELLNTTGSWTADTNNWNASTATWTNSSAVVGSTSYGSAALSNATLGAALPTITLDAAGISLVQGWVNTPSSNTGWALQTDYSTGNSDFVLQLCSANYGTESSRPKLTITYDGGSVGPEITLQGQGLTINSGDTTPTSANDSNFGEVVMDGSSVTHTFTVRNEGDATLNLTGDPRIGVSGTHAGDFTVTSLPSASLAAGGTSTFQITFTPGGSDLRTATIAISNDDSDEGSYTFAVSGSGLLGDNYTSWISGYNVGTQTGASDDPDMDGLSNGIENYFGTDPSAKSAGVVVGGANTAAGTFSFSHPLNSNAASDFTATYRWSKDLATFHADGATDAGGATVTFTQGAPSGGQVDVTATITGTGSQSIFVQVVVTQN